jgi:threonine/homoserine/homoserine lactone efflux protein
MSVGFLLTSLVVVATPGTGVLYTVAAGLSRGARASAIAAVGCPLGIVPHMLAWSALRERGALAVELDTTPRTAKKVIVSGVLINLLNPKLTIFFFAFLPQFVSSGEPHAFLRMLGLSAIFMLMTLVVFVVYGRFAVAVRSHVIARPQVMTWLRRTFAGAFAALGARLAFSER